MSPSAMQSTGQFDLQVPQAMQVSKIFLGIDNPPSLAKTLFPPFILLEIEQNVNDYFHTGRFFAPLLTLFLGKNKEYGQSSRCTIDDKMHRSNGGVAALKCIQ